MTHRYPNSIQTVIRHSTEIIFGDPRVPMSFQTGETFGGTEDGTVGPFVGDGDERGGLTGEGGTVERSVVEEGGHHPVFYNYRGE